MLCVKYRKNVHWYLDLFLTLNMSVIKKKNFIETLIIITTVIYY